MSRESAGNAAMRDEFLSEEDLDLRNLSDVELQTYWDLWLRQAQASNDLDANAYSHGVFMAIERTERDAERPGGAGRRG